MRDAIIPSHPIHQMYRIWLGMGWDMKCIACLLMVVATSTLGYSYWMHAMHLLVW